MYQFLRFLNVFDTIMRISGFICLKGRGCDSFLKLMLSLFEMQICVPSIS